jgi:hypothetical protein
MAMFIKSWLKGENLTFIGEISKNNFLLSDAKILRFNLASLIKYHSKQYRHKIIVRLKLTQIPAAHDAPLADPPCQSLVVMDTHVGCQFGVHVHDRALLIFRTGDTHYLVISTTLVYSYCRIQGS